MVIDGHESHIKFEVRQLAKEHSIIIAKLPSHATHLLQPLDLGIFKPLKAAYDSAAHRFFLRRCTYINKKNFPSILAEAWKSFKPETAVNSFRKAGIVPFNKDAVSQTSLTHSVPYSISVVNDNNDDNADDSSRIDTTPADVLSLTDLLGNDVEEVIPTIYFLEPCTSTHCTPT